MKTLVSLRLLLICIWCLSFTTTAHAQAPANDNCENADEIVIGGNGYAFGKFTSVKSNINFATKQRGEKCSGELEINGNCDKTVWYKFYIPTTRNISVELTQKDSAIPQIFAGFNIYAVKNCDYGLDNIENRLTPLSKFGVSGNTCLTQGWYFIQIGTKQKAKGELWVVINAADHAPQNFDLPSTLYDFGLISNTIKTQYFNPACASVEEPEAVAINDSSFNRSLFFSFTLAANAVSNSMNIYFYSGKWKYRIFYESMNADSISGAKPFVNLKQGTNEIIKEFCPIVNNQRKFYVQLITDNETNTYAQVNVSNTLFTSDDWNNFSTTTDIINTNNNFNRTKFHDFNCEGLLKRHGCKPVIPDQYVLENIYGKDTYRTNYNMAGYTIIHVGESGVLEVTSSENNFVMGMYYVLYKGNLKNNCNISLVKKEYNTKFEVCVEPGTYTLLTCAISGNTYRTIRHNISQSKPPLSIVHYWPKAPEKIGDIDPKNTQRIYTKTIHFKEDRDTVLNIDTFKIKGWMVFHELKLTDSGRLSIYSANYKVKLYIFKGRISLGNIKIIPNIPPYGSYAIQLPNCIILDTGYYTIVSAMDTSFRRPVCLPNSNFLTIEKESFCTQFVFNTPLKAFKINNNNNVLSASANFKNLDYVFDLQYCSDCYTDNRIKPTLLNYKKRYVYPSTRYTYFTFKLDKNAEFRLVQVPDYNFELYKGDCTSNPAIINDTANIVSACQFGNNYCNLEAGIYTIVLFNTGSFGQKAVFTPHVVSPNDYATKPYNFGHFNVNAIKTSPPLPITCHTNASVTDPCYSPYNYEQCMRSSSPVLIPFKDTLNVKRYYYRKNLWYTFTVENTSKITVSVKGNTLLNKTPKLNVFRYLGEFNTDFNAVLAAGLDSTKKSMQFITGNRMYIDNNTDRENSISFDNFGCSKNRYFVLLEDENYYDYAHYDYILTVDYKSNNLSNNGDFCSNASVNNIVGLQTKNVTANNSCHTIGNSPYESDTIKGLKSSWFQINVSGVNSCDIKIRNIAGTGLKHYNVYGGTCNNMTRVAKLSDLYAYFTLSCMGSGTYYIQAVCDEKINTDLTFEVTTSKVENSSCKPYDFNQPIAQFNMNGGCNGDTLKFINLSSEGAAVTYKWQINQNTFSTEKDPILSIKDPLVNTNNLIRLIVKNNAFQLSDTFTLPFSPDTAKYSFKIKGKSIARCDDTVILKVQTDFPYKINYTWTDLYNPLPDHSKEKVIIYPGYEKRTYYVKGESDNCLFKDSFVVKVPIDMDRYNDTFICGKDQFVIHNRSKNIMYLNGISFSDSVIIKDSGIYRIYYNDGNCWFNETFRVDIDTGKNTLNLKDTVFACDQFAELRYKGKLKSYSWSTGETSSSIKVSQSGKYSLSGPLNDCRSISIEFDVRNRIVNKDILKDTAVCSGSNIQFINPYPEFKVIFKQPNSNQILAKQTFKKSLRLANDQCIVNDSSWVYVNVPKNVDFEKEICNIYQQSSLELDGGNAINYLWRPSMQTDRYLTITDTGSYRVERTDLNLCKDTWHFVVNSNCPLSVFIPNAFTPNADLLNEGFGPIITGDYSLYTFRIFNRWGELLFETEKDLKWNGSYMNEPVQDGVYSYLVNIKDKNGKEFVFRGTFNLMR